MADLITELRRPSTLGASIFAVLGWLLLIWSLAQSTSDQDNLRSRLAAAEQGRDQANTALKQERDAAGALADIVAKRDAAQQATQRARTEADQAARDRATAQDQLTALTGKIKATTDQKTDLDKTLATETVQRDTLSGNLDTLRQQIETVKQAFASASNQLAQKNSELAGLNDRLQKAQAALQQSSKDQTASAQVLTQGRKQIEDLMAQRTTLDKAVADLKTQQTTAAASTTTAESRVADLGRQRQDLETAVGKAQATLNDLQARIDAAKAQMPNPPPTPDLPKP